MCFALFFFFFPSRQIQRLRDPEGAECQEYDHHGAGKRAMLGTGLHVVRLCI